MSYINSRMKEEIAVLATLVEYCEDMAHSEAPEFKRSRRQAQAMARNAQKVFDAAIEDLDTDQLFAILRLAKQTRFALVQKSSPRAHYDTYIVKEETFRRLVMDPAGECSFCTKEGKEIKAASAERILRNAAW